MASVSFKDDCVVVYEEDGCWGRSICLIGLKDLVDTLESACNFHVDLVGPESVCELASEMIYSATVQFLRSALSSIEKSTRNKLRMKYLRLKNDANNGNPVPPNLPKVAASSMSTGFPADSVVTFEEGDPLLSAKTSVPSEKVLQTTAEIKTEYNDNDGHGDSWGSPDSPEHDNGTDEGVPQSTAASGGLMHASRNQNGESRIIGYQVQNDDVDTTLGTQGNRTSEDRLVPVLRSRITKGTSDDVNLDSHVDLTPTTNTEAKSIRRKSKGFGVKQVGSFYQSRSKGVNTRASKQALDGEKLSEPSSSKRQSQTAKRRTKAQKKDDDKHCPVCFKSITSSMSYHMRTHSEKRHQCQICGKSFMLSAGLRSHMVTHSGERAHTCEICGMNFTQRSSLREHVLLHTGEKSFECNTCGKFFRLRKGLKSHMKHRHSQDRPYVCEICGKASKSSSALQKHLFTHSGEKPFTCEWCGQSFAAKGHLKTHTRKHTGEKPYLCSHCGKGFASNFVLVNHTRLHTGEKPYTCVTCGKAFAKRSNMLTHHKVHRNKGVGLCS